MQATKYRGWKAWVLIWVCLTTSGSLWARGNDSYILATATTGGTYYPVGVALATLTKMKLAPQSNIAFSAISSAGSAENIKLLRTNEAQFAILQGLYGAWAWQGAGPLAQSGPQKNLRAITLLWRNVEHFAVKSDHVKTGTMADLANLAGAKFSIGVRNSGTEGSGRHILHSLGIDIEQAITPVYLGYGPSASALQNGTIEGFNIPAGIPVAAISQAFASLGNQLTILSFTPEQIRQANQQYNLWTAFTIPANTYSGQNTPVKTMAQPNFLAVREDLDSTVVYAITKTIFENLAFLQHIHKATQDISLDTALEGLPVPLHPGAIRYYQEQGVKIPAALIIK